MATVMSKKSQSSIESDNSESGSSDPWMCWICGRTLEQQANSGRR